MFNGTYLKKERPVETTLTTSLGTKYIPNCETVYESNPSSIKIRQEKKLNKKALTLNEWKSWHLE